MDDARDHKISYETAYGEIQDDSLKTQEKIKGIKNTTHGVEEYWDDMNDSHDETEFPQGQQPQSQPQQGQQAQSPPQQGQQPQSPPQQAQEQPSQSPLDYVLEKQSDSLPDYSDDLD